MRNPVERCATFPSPVNWTIRAVEICTSEALRRQGGTLLAPVLLDVTDEASITSAARQVDVAVGTAGLGALVNNAGIAVVGAWEHLARERLLQQFEVNLFGTIAVTQAFLPLIRRGRGRIITVTSIAGKHAPPLLRPLCRVKARARGVRRLAEARAEAVGDPRQPDRARGDRYPDLGKGPLPRG
ncbi:MAG: SDR family NAD(P)-dependent oxidoreductase [Chloroflexi bacterium]|nr:SDR family NAD(P)-dependent oxidoreductase [Chloroflexota bacterium]